MRNARMPSPGGFPADGSTPFGITSTSSLPGSMRFQQWFSELEARDRLTEARPIVGLAYDFGTTLGPAAPTLDVEVRMAQTQNGLSSNFATNVQGGVAVIPRTMLTLPNHGTGTSFTLPFAQPFAWDGTSNLVVDITIYATNLQPGQFYQVLDVTGANWGSGLLPPKTSRVFAAPWSAPTGTLQFGTGNFTRFQFLGGASAVFGSGCPGANNVVPAIFESSAPQVALQPWSVGVRFAPAGAAAALVVGGSRVWWGTPGGALLPISLASVGGAGCNLIVDPVLQIPMTVDASGQASIVIPIDPSLPPGGLGFEWVVLDPAAPNGAMSTTRGLWSIFG